MNFQDSFNRQICSGNKTASTCTSDTRIYVEKPPQGEEEKTTAVDQPVHASFTMSNLDTEFSLEHLEIYNTLQHVANRQQQQQPLEGRLQQSRDITDSVPFGNKQIAHKPRLQTAPNLADRHAYVFPIISPNFSSIGHRLPAQTVHLPKLSILKLQQSELTEPLSNLMLY